MTTATDLSGEVYRIKGIPAAEGEWWMGILKVDGSFPAAMKRYGSGWNGTGNTGDEIVNCTRPTKAEAIAWVRGRLEELGRPNAPIEVEEGDAR